MTTIEKLKERENDVFPKNKIILLDGSTLYCYPMAIGCQDSNADESEQLFTSNAFYLLAHKERILSDSRMFLCPLAVRNGLYYTGGMGFSFPTLGVYLEWWSYADGAMITNELGRRGLVYRLSGSPFSGANKCGVVYEDGETEIVSLRSFIDKWSPFTKINGRYSEAKNLYQAYTMQHVIDILNKEDDGNRDYASEIEKHYMTNEIEVLHERLDKTRKDRDRWHDMYISTIVKYNAEKFRNFYSEYEACLGKINAEMKLLREKRQKLRMELRQIRNDNHCHQSRMQPLNKRMKELKHEITTYQYDKVREAFPNESAIDFRMIEQFVLGERREQKPT